MAAFTANPTHGNPARVWIGDELPEPSEMLTLEAEVGYSETAFLAPAGGDRRTIRYFCREAEVPLTSASEEAHRWAAGE